jgi:hypothetical protein
LARYLGIELEQVEKALGFLEKVQIIEKVDEHYTPMIKLMHLGKDSHFLYQYHLNLRVKALQMLEEKKSKASHYSVVVSLSEKDCLDFQQELVDLSKKFMIRVKNSNEETLRAFIYDFFPLEHGFEKI